MSDPMANSLWGQSSELSFSPKAPSTTPCVRHGKKDTKCCFPICKTRHWDSAVRFKVCGFPHCAARCSKKGMNELQTGWRVCTQSREGL
jgi:hypothetical protein